MRDHDPFYFNQFSRLRILPKFWRKSMDFLPIQIDLFAIYQIKHENIFKSFGTSNVEDNSNLTHKILLTIAFHSQWKERGK